jgi:hypothetical protein
MSAIAHPIGPLVVSLSCMLRPCRSWLIFSLCAPLWAAVPLHAQQQSSAPISAEATDQARQLFNEGLALVEHEDWAGAEERFRRVLSLRSSHVVSYNLASALTHLGRLVESAELLRAIVRDPSVDATTHGAAAQLLSEIEPRIGSLTIRVTGDATGASLSLDDKPIELTAQVQTISVDPGEHRAVLQRDGAVLASKSAAVGDHAPLQAELVLELPVPVAPEAVARAAPVAVARPRSEVGVAPSETADEGAQPASTSVLSRWWFWTAAGALVAGGVVTALVASSAGKASPVSGDTNPPLIRGQVKGMP